MADQTASNSGEPETFSFKAAFVPATEWTQRTSFMDKAAFVSLTCEFPRKPPNLTPRSMRKKRILIVDDEVSLTRLMRIALEQTGKYEVRAENDATAVIAAALEFKPDMIVLDLIMPEQDGGDVAEALRMHPELKEIPIVFLSASVRKSEIDAHGGVLGGFPFLAKPTSAEAISAFIEKHLPA